MTKAEAEGTRNESERGKRSRCTREPISSRRLFSFPRIFCPAKTDRASSRRGSPSLPSNPPCRWSFEGVKSANLSYRDMLEWPLVRSKKSDATNGSKLSSARRGVALLRAIRFSHETFAHPIRRLIMISRIEQISRYNFARRQLPHTNQP